MANPDTTNVPANGDANAPVPVPGAGEASIVPFDPRALQQLESEGMQPEAAAIASPLSMANLVKAFRHRWMLAVSVGLTLGVLCAGAVFYFVSAKFTAYALLHVSEAEPEPLIPDQRKAATASERYFENTQVAIIKSKPIVLASLRRPGISELGLIRRPGRSRGLVGGEPESRLPRKDRPPSHLSGWHGTRGPGGPRQRRQGCLHGGGSQRSTQEEAASAGRAGKNLPQRRGQNPGPTGSGSRLGQAAEIERCSGAQHAPEGRSRDLRALQRQLTELEAKIRTTEIALAWNKSNDGQTKIAIPESVLDAGIEIDPQVVQKKAQIQMLDGQISHWVSTTEPDHPRRLQLESQRKQLEQELEQIRTQARASQKKMFQDRMRSDQEVETQKARKDIEMWRRQEEILKGKVTEALNEAQSIGLTTFELELKKSEFEQAEAVIRRLREEKERLNIELQSNNQRVSVHQAAEPPKKKNWIDKARLVGFAGALGLVAGLFGICYWEAQPPHSEQGRSSQHARLSSRRRATVGQRSGAGPARTGGRSDDPADGLDGRPARASCCARRKERQPAEF